MGIIKDAQNAAFIKQLRRAISELGDEIKKAKKNISSEYFQTDKDKDKEKE